MSMPTSNNSLPDVWDSSSHHQVLESLSNDLPTLLNFSPYPDSLVGVPEPIPRLSPRRAPSIELKVRQGEELVEGVVSVQKSLAYDMRNEIGSSSGSRHGHGYGRVPTMSYILIPAPDTTMDMPQPGVPHMPMPISMHGPPIKFDGTGDYAGFVNHSNHRVMYKNKLYPTALHLLEAMKFTHQPALQERIRTCVDVNDMYPLSASFQEHVRSDWGQVFLQTMEDVLYLKFRQHPGLRPLLLRTGLADIVYADDNTYWGEGPLGEGANQLGRSLVRLRERLRQML